MITEFQPISLFSYTFCSILYSIKRVAGMVSFVDNDTDNDGEGDKYTTAIWFTMRVVVN